MSLRPSERVEVRRNRYKVAVDAEEGRRRREDNMVEIRKSRREESLLKRRREGLQAQVPVPASGVEKKVRIRPAPSPQCSVFLFVIALLRGCRRIRITSRLDECCVRSAELHAPILRCLVTFPLFFNACEL